jgi:N-acetylmuramoyl-L-alanine amidase
VLQFLAAVLMMASEPSFVVVLDAGHGGEQPGALASDGSAEKDLTLQIARLLARQLERQGARVVFTRSGDITVPLAARPAAATAERADLFISVHANSMPTRTQRLKTHGVETYFLSPDASDASATAVATRENADRLAGEPEPELADPVNGILMDLETTAALQASSQLAYAVHEKVIAATHAENRGVKQAPFYVLAGVRMPAVLLEVGFISHPQESLKLRSPAYQETLAKAIAAGVAAFRAKTKAASR